MIHFIKGFGIGLCVGLGVVLIADYGKKLIDKKKEEEERIPIKDIIERSDKETVTDTDTDIHNESLVEEKNEYKKIVSDHYSNLDPDEIKDAIEKATNKKKEKEPYLISSETFDNLAESGYEVKTGVYMIDPESGYGHLILDGNIINEESDIIHIIGAEGIDAIESGEKELFIANDLEVKTVYEISVEMEE